MSGFGRLVATEVRRCLARRAVRVLVGVGVLLIAVVAVTTFVVSAPEDVARSGPTPIRLTDLWNPERDSVFGMGIVILAMGALIGGAVVVGGEWKAGTVTTLLTWEPRRARVIGARLAACGLLAAAIGAVLAVLLVVALLPGVVVKGSTAGVDAAWSVSLLAALARGLLLASLSAVLGAAIAWLGRSATAALVAVIAYLIVVEPAFRAWWPTRAGWLIGENAATFFTGRAMEGVPFVRRPVEAALILAGYVVIAAAAATAAFTRRDVTGGA